MATIVCQGLQSCTDSQIYEPIRTIRLKLSCSIDEKKISSSTDDDADADSHCWKSFFFQNFSKNGFKSEPAANKETTTPNYVHPLDTRFKPAALSEKSLELCTENLGSETGTDIIEEEDCGCNGGDSGGGLYVSPRREQQQQRECDVKKVMMTPPKNFPPPLTTITGVGSLQVRPQREDGRLIIKATKAPLPHCSVFQAERTQGRLRLCIFKDSEEEEEEEEEEEDENYIAGEEGEEGDDVVEDDFEEEIDGYMGGEEEEEEEEEEGVNGENRNIEGKIGIKKFDRPRRCKEGGEPEKGLMNWEALWVATS